MDDNGIILEYEETETNEVHYEEIVDFDKSLFQHVYYSAFKQVESILKCNKETGEQGGNEGRKTGQIDNLICFVGESGMGKTSAMLSFMEALKDYYYIKKEEDIFYKFKVKEKNTKVSFLCLDCIDASLLETGEDLFEVILTMMYDKLISLESENYLKEESSADQRNQLLNEFDRTFSGIRNLKKHKNGNWEDEEYGSYVGNLKTMSISMTLKKQFENLVKTYLNLIQFSKEAELPDGWQCGRLPFLVITIDDLDLSLESGFEMLEQIHRYLMIRQVIVLISVDDIQMREICEKHFWKLYQDNPNRQRLTEWEEQVQYTARQYMGKVLPIYRRIYMPRLQDMKEDVRIRKGGSGSGKNIKHFLLHKIASTTFTCFDMCGDKQHFYEPKTVRGIIALCRFLDRLESLESNDGKISIWYEPNYSQVLYDICNRMASEQLFGRHYQTFKWICEQRLKKRGEIACNKLEAFQGEQAQAEPDHDEGENQYSYGKLLKVMYYFGRMNPQNKALVKCLLAFFSVVYTREYVLLQYGNEQQRNEAKINLGALLGRSVTGDRTNRMLPQFLINSKQTDDKVIYEIGTIKSARVGKALTTSMPKEWAMCCNQEELIKKIAQGEMDFAWIQEVELLLMLFSDFRDEMNNRIRCKLEIRTSQMQRKESIEALKADPALIGVAEDNTIEMIGRADFNLFGFVLNLYRWEEFFEEIDSAVLRMLKQYYKISDDVCMEKLRRYVEDNSLKKKYQKWFETYRGFALPFYNIDMTYNVIKRCIHEFQRLNEQVMNETHIVEQMHMLYQRVGNQLQYEDELYKESEKMGLCIGAWNSAFGGNPFVKEFEKRCVNDTSLKFRMECMIKTLCELNIPSCCKCYKDEVSTIDVAGSM